MDTPSVSSVYVTPRRAVFAVDAGERPMGRTAEELVNASIDGARKAINEGKIVSVPRDVLKHPENASPERNKAASKALDLDPRKTSGKRVVKC